MKFVCCCLGLILVLFSSCSVEENSEKIWVEAARGLIVMEAESAPGANLDDKWIEPGVLEDYTGSSYVKYDGVSMINPKPEGGGDEFAPLEYIEDPNAILTYKFRASRTGNWLVRLRVHHVKEDGDNDIWVWSDMIQNEDFKEEWTKFGIVGYEDEWAFTGSTGNFLNFRTVSGSTYTLKIAGRSRGLSVDRIVIYDPNEYNIEYNNTTKLYTITSDYVKLENTDQAFE